MLPIISPLNEQQIRSIIRAHPAPCAEVVLAGETDPAQIAMSVTRVLLANPQIIDELAAAGLGKTVEEVRGLGLLRWLIALNVIRSTGERGDASAILAILFEELAPLALPQGAAQ